MTVSSVASGAGSGASGAESIFFLGDLPDASKSEEVFLRSTVIDAIIKNRLLELSLVLSTGPISLEDRGWAVIVAAGREDSGALRILLSTPVGGGVVIAGQHRGVALVAAFEQKCYPSMSLLLADISEISREILRLILRLAAHRGDCTALEILRASGALTDDDCGKAVIIACDAGKVDVLRFFLENFSISKKDLEKARKCAADNMEITTLIDEVIGPPSSCTIM